MASDYPKIANLFIEGVGDCIPQLVRSCLSDGEIPLANVGQLTKEVLQEANPRIVRAATLAAPSSPVAFHELCAESIIGTINYVVNEWRKTRGMFPVFARGEASDPMWWEFTF